ncbi:MAG: DMT family transporter [Balneolaceae bacterium]|nr:DMT family transporter [Balneolaceae bacterium]
MSGWIYILLSASFSVLIAHLLKVIEFRKFNTIKVLTINYLVATFVAFATSNKGGPILESETGNLFAAGTLAVFTGFIFIANFFIYSKSVNLNGVGISVAAMRISLIVPVLLSTLWYLEYISVAQWIGVMLVFVTLFLLLPDKGRLIREPFSAGWLLVLLFLGTGFGDAALKIYESDFSGTWVKQQFMGMVFLTAFMSGLTILVFRKDLRFTMKDFWMGAAIGVPNLYTSIFLIEALERMNGAVVYSAVNVITVLGATILGILRWGDRLNLFQWAGIVFTLISILLLI